MRDVSKTPAAPRRPALVGVDPAGGGRTSVRRRVGPARRCWRRRCSDPRTDAGGRSIEADVAGLTTDRTADERRAAQMIFQNPDWRNRN
jgi:hypothetical protein